MTPVSLGALACISTPATCDPLELKVQTMNGLIDGHPADNRTAVAEYLGIQYAQPPVGELRFTAPDPYRSTGAHTASKFVSHHSPCLRFHRSSSPN